MQLFSDDEFIFQFIYFFGELACQRGVRTTHQDCNDQKNTFFKEKHNFITILHLSLKYPQNLERFNCFTLNERTMQFGTNEKERTQTYSETIICVLNAIRKCVRMCVCLLFHSLIHSV